MIITQGQLLEGINEYIDSDVLVHTNKMTSVEQFIFGMKVGIFKRSLPKVINTYLNTNQMKLLGVVTDEGVDLDILYNAALDSIHKTGVVEYNGLRFDESDVEKLYDILKRRGGTNA